MATEATTSAPATGATTSIWAFLGRLSWMFVGPFALAICAIGIAHQGDGRFSPSDLIYFVVLGGMLIGRRLEFWHGRPMTATGEPATAAHLRRYTLVLSILGLGVWVAIKLIASQAIPNLG